MKRRIIILCSVPISILTICFILYITRSEVNFRLSELEVDSIVFQTNQPFEFGDLTGLKKIDLYNTSLQVRNIDLAFSNLPDVPLQRYNQINFIPIKENSQFTIKYSESQKDNNEMDFVIDSRNTNLNTVISINKNHKIETISLSILSSFPAYGVSPRSEKVYLNGRISPVHGDTENPEVYDLFIKDYKIELLNLDNKIIKKLSSADFRLVFSKYSDLKFETYHGSEGAKIRFFFYERSDEKKKDVLFHKTFNDTNVHLSDIKLNAIKSQNDKLTITYKASDEASPKIHSSDALEIKGKKIRLVKDIILSSEKLLVSLDGESHSIKRNNIELIINNFERVDTFFSAIIILIAYVLDKLITISEFFKPDKNGKN